MTAIRRLYGDVFGRIVAHTEDGDVYVSNSTPEDLIKLELGSRNVLMYYEGGAMRAVQANMRHNKLGSIPMRRIFVKSFIRTISGDALLACGAAVYLGVFHKESLVIITGGIIFENTNGNTSPLLTMFKGKFYCDDIINGAHSEIVPIGQVAGLMPTKNIIVRVIAVYIDKLGIIRIDAGSHGKFTLVTVYATSVKTITLDTSNLAYPIVVTDLAGNVTNFRFIIDYNSEKYMLETKLGTKMHLKHRDLLFSTLGRVELYPVYRTLVPDTYIVPAVNCAIYVESSVGLSLIHCIGKTCFLYPREEPAEIVPIEV